MNARSFTLSGIRALYKRSEFKFVKSLFVLLLIIFSFTSGGCVPRAECNIDASNFENFRSLIMKKVAENYSSQVLSDLSVKSSNIDQLNGDNYFHDVLIIMKSGKKIEVYTLVNKCGKLIDFVTKEIK
jgi:hypothetical protein